MSDPTKEEKAQAKLLKAQKKKEKEEKKRKRDNDSEDRAELSTSKKSKKSSGESAPPPVEDAPVAKNKKEKKAKTRETSDEVAGVSADADGKPEKKKKSKKAKKAEASADSDEDVAMEEAPAQDTILQEDFIRFDDKPSDTFEGALKKDKKKSKEERKAEKAAKKAAKTETNSGPVTEANDIEEGASEEQAAGATEEVTTSKSRFIVFVGNLPFSATKEEIQTHFSKVQPKDIRLMTDKETGKPKGFAFVEFDRFDRMETCLKKYQHSVFPDGKKGRKINIELTVGGGGSTEARKQKIQAKNIKLDDERQRDREKREEVEAKQKERKEKKETRKQQEQGGEIEKDDAGTGSDEQTDENAGMHPARLAMIQQPAGSGSHDDSNFASSGRHGKQYFSQGGRNQRGGRNGGGRGRGRGRGKGRF